MDSEKAKILAEQIVLLLQQGEKPSNDFSALQASLEKINQRLDKIENGLDAQKSNGFHPSSFNLHSSQSHPSQEKFAVAEAVANQLIEHFNVEKACAFEPNGKPCDHCSMCNSRGF